VLASHVPIGQFRLSGTFSTCQQYQGRRLACIEGSKQTRLIGQGHTQAWDLPGRATA